MSVTDVARFHDVSRWAIARLRDANSLTALPQD